MRKNKLLSMSLAACLAVSAGMGLTASQKNTKDIVIGANFELSGSGSAFGEESVRGITLAVEEVNKAGGIDGRKIKLKVMDNRASTEEVVAVAKRLISKEGVSAIIGPVSSDGTIAEREVLEKSKIPLISGTATKDEVTQDKSGKTLKYVFRTCFKDSFQGYVMAKFLKDTPKLKIKKVAVLVDNARVYSKGLAESFTNAYKKNGGKIIAQESFNSDEKDYRAVLTRIRSKKPDAIYIPAYYDVSGPMIKQARELGLNCAVLGCDGFDDPKLAQIAGKENMKNVYFTNHYSPEIATPEAQAFNKNFKAKYKKLPNALSALNYDTAKCLFEAIKKAGSTEPDKIVKALEGIKNFKGVTGQFSIDKNHNTIKNAVIITMNGDKQKYYTTVKAEN